MGKTGLYRKSQIIFWYQIIKTKTYKIKPSMLEGLIIFRYVDANRMAKISGEVKYDNPWIKVTEDQVLNPAGNPGIYGKVHFKNLAIGIVPVDSNGYIYFVRQFRYVLNNYSLEIPEGGGPLDIDPLETAKKN